MPRPASPPAPRPSTVPWFRLSLRAGLAIAAAVAAGLLLFLVIWLGERGDRTESGSAVGSRTVDGRVLAPLPAPGSLDADGIGMAAPGNAPPATPRGAPIPTPPEQMPAPTPAPAAPEASRTPAMAPVPTHMPAPRYPVSALRRGESGEVRVRIVVDPGGRPSDVAVDRSSGSRDLDRAALSAARNWRFKPAHRGGAPVEGTVIVPISFDSRR